MLLSLLCTSCCCYGFFALACWQPLRLPLSKLSLGAVAVLGGGTQGSLP